MARNKTPSRPVKSGFSSPPPSALAISSRTTTPGRTNKSGVPDNINTLLVLDLHAQVPLPNRPEEEKYNTDSCSLIQRAEYKPYNRKKIRHRFYYLRNLRFESNKTEWKELVQWAQNYAKDHLNKVSDTESEPVMPSECISLFLLLILNIISPSLQTATRGQAKTSEDEENDKTIDGIEYLPPREKPKKMDKSQEKVASMSTGAAKVAENASMGNLFSEADADISPEDWKAEDVFLGSGFEKKVDMGSHKMRWTAYNIVVLTHCDEDKTAVTATPITDPKTGTIRTVRIQKPRIPGILQNEKGEVVISYLLGGNKRAAVSFGEAVYNDNGDLYTIVDVHFPNPIRKIISHVNDVHLNIEGKNKIQCKFCGIQEVLETANAVAFEVEEVAVRQTAAKKTKKKNMKCEISE